MIEAKEKDGLVYYSSALLARAGAHHVFFSRRGGVSPEPFDTLNFAVKVGDEPANVAENMARAARALFLPVDRTVTVRQVHGREAAVVDGPADPSTEADAVMTERAGLPVGVLTADCLPVLIYDPVKRAAAAVHAGWRGTALGVAGSAVRSMEEAFGTRPADIIAALGPRIGPCCYTVGPDVLDEFTGAFGEPAEGFFSRDAKGALKCDLGAANTYALVRAGVAPPNIDTGAPCTFCTDGLFFSFRKEAGPGAARETGRLLSLIMV